MVGKIAGKAPNRGFFYFIPLILYFWEYMPERRPFFKRKIVKIILLCIVLVIAVAAILGYGMYKKIMLSNVSVGEQKGDVYISSKDDLNTLFEQLKENNLLKDPDAFLWWAAKRHLDTHLQPGHYLVTNGMSNRDLVNLFGSGRQTPVNVTFNNIRTKTDFAARIGEQLEPDSADFMQYFDTSTVFAKLGLTKDNFMTLFIPNTYELYWTSTTENFIQRMKREHDAFWTEKRTAQAKKIGLTPEQVYILASIVYSENEKAADEAPRIAGVYMNRILDNEKLEADPTVKFAIGDFAKKRIYLTDLEIDSPYNTYKNYGLPPGPIHMPPIAYIDAVLNYEHHDYKFMCARGDGSGYHYFAKTLAEHNRNRQLYIQALEKAGIH